MADGVANKACDFNSRDRGLHPVSCFKLVKH